MSQQYLKYPQLCITFLTVESTVLKKIIFGNAFFTYMFLDFHKGSQDYNCPTQKLNVYDINSNVVFLYSFLLNLKHLTANKKGRYTYTSKPYKRRIPVKNSHFS